MPVPVALSMMIEELDRLGRERDDAWQIPRVEGELLRQIALTHNAKLIIEIGTSYGFSGLFWASALRVERRDAAHGRQRPAQIRTFQSHIRQGRRRSVSSSITWAMAARSIIPTLPDAGSTSLSSTPTSRRRRPISTCSGPSCASAGACSSTMRRRIARSSPPSPTALAAEGGCV